MNDKIDITQLTPEQLATLRKQFKAQAKVSASQLEQRNGIIDTMLKDKDPVHGTFKHTTSDILAALNKANLVKDEDMKGKERTEWLKRIQTRKQHLVKMVTKEGKPVHPPNTFGYCPSATGLGVLTKDRVIDWLMTQANVDLLTPSEVKAIAKTMKEAM